MDTNGIENDIFENDNFENDNFENDNFENDNFENNNHNYDNPFTEPLLGYRDFTSIFKNKKHYWKYLLIIGAFYCLPSLQFVMFQEERDSELCYFNNKCKHSLGKIVAFNNVISNIFYIFFGLIFIVIVRCTENQKMYRRLTTEQMDESINEVATEEERRNIRDITKICSNRIDRDPSLYYALGVVLIMEGIFSGIYHVCPSKLNFQFDTSFMFIGTSLMFLTIYQKRHINKIPSPFRTYTFLAFVIFLNMLPLTDISSGLEVWFWLMIYFLVIYLVVIGSINIYYGTDWGIDTKLPGRIVSAFRHRKSFNLPKLALVTVLNTFTLSMVIYAQASEQLEFTNWMLSIFILNLVIYFLYYMINKVQDREPMGNKLWLSILANIIILMIAIIFYEAAVTDKMETHTESNKLNKPCALFGYWDYHDIWHIMSAIGLFMTMCIVYVLDRGLISAEPSMLRIF